MFESIDKNVCRSVTLSRTELDIFHSLLSPKKVPKKTMLLRAGEICNFEAYIVKGCIRTYYVDDNGSEVIIQFGIEDWWVGDLASFNDQLPSNLFIEALEDSELLVLSPQTKEDLLLKVPKFERVFRLLIQRNLSATLNRLVKTIAQTGEQKYLDFLKKYPTIPQRVPQHYIASYLGITPEFLSKIRKKLVRQTD